MRIIIEAPEATPTRGAANEVSVESPAAPDTADGGAGPASGASPATASADTGGPPEWLVAAIAAAESSAQGSFGTAPPAPGDYASGSDAAQVADAGGGPQ